MSFIMTSRPQSCGSTICRSKAPGLLVKGRSRCDGAGDIQAANLTNFNLSDGDKATLRAERGPDGALRVTVRGDVYDGRGFIKSSMAGPTPAQAKNAKLKDIDVDVRLGTVAGFHGETMRSLDLQDVAPQRQHHELLAGGAARARHAALRRSARTRRRPQRHLRRDQGCRRAVPLQRHLSEDLRRRDVDGDGSADRQQRAAGRHPQYPRLQRARRADARSRRLRQCRSARARRRPEPRRRVLAHARRVHPHPRPLRHPRRRRCAAR